MTNGLNWNWHSCQLASYLLLIVLSLQPWHRRHYVQPSLIKYAKLLLFSFRYMSFSGLFIVVLYIYVNVLKQWSYYYFFLTDTLRPYGKKALLMLKPSNKQTERVLFNTSNVQSQQQSLVLPTLVICFVVSVKFRGIESLVVINLSVSFDKF